MGWFEIYKKKVLVNITYITIYKINNLKFIFTKFDLNTGKYRKYPKKSKTQDFNINLLSKCKLTGWAYLVSDESHCIIYNEYVCVGVYISSFSDDENGFTTPTLINR